MPSKKPARTVRDRLDPEDEHDWLLVATAHPAKFPEVVEPRIGHEVDIPEHRAEVMARSKEVPLIEPTMDGLGEVVFATEPSASA